MSTFRLPGFVESNFFTNILGGGFQLDKKLIGDFEFTEFADGGISVFRKPNEIGGYDYLPFQEIIFDEGELPPFDKSKDRMLAGYKGWVFVCLGEVIQRQNIRHDDTGRNNEESF